MLIAHSPARRQNALLFSRCKGVPLILTGSPMLWETAVIYLFIYFAPCSSVRLCFEKQRWGLFPSGLAAHSNEATILGMQDPSRFKHMRILHAAFVWAQQPILMNGAAVPIGNKVPDFVFLFFFFYLKMWPHEQHCAVAYCSLLHLKMHHFS